MGDEQRKKLVEKGKKLAAYTVTLGLGVGTGFEGLASTHELAERLTNEGSLSNSLKIPVRIFINKEFLPHGPETSPSYAPTVERIAAMASTTSSHKVLPFEWRGWTIFYSKLPRYLDPPKQS